MSFNISAYLSLAGLYLAIGCQYFQNTASRKSFAVGGGYFHFGNNHFFVQFPVIKDVTQVFADSGSLNIK